MTPQERCRTYRSLQAKANMDNRCRSGREGQCGNSLTMIFNSGHMKRPEFSVPFILSRHSRPMRKNFDIYSGKADSG